MTEVAIKDPYLVKRGDTLSAIAKASGKSVSELKAFNKLDNQNLIEVGQTLYLSRETAFGVSVLFLDALRHPIENLPYRITHDQQMKSGTTPANGAVPRITTDDAQSHIEIVVQGLHGQWVNACNVTSGYGHKLVTLVSGAFVFRGVTEKHPKDAPAETESSANSRSARTTQAEETPTKNNPHVKTKRVTGKHGQAIIEVSVDIPDGLKELFDLYTGAEISRDQWNDAASALECEPAVLKAIAEVESNGTAFWRLNKGDGKHVPSILFERHKFRDATKKAYDQTYPDISGPPYTWDKKAATGDRYGSYSVNYLRLINAYRLDATAALSSVSWGKFQIMGGEFPTCDLRSVEKLVIKMCTSEVEQLDLLAAFIQKKAKGKLWNAVKSKDWPKFALYYNGPKYAKNHYDVKLQTAYEKYKSDKA